ncbi:Uu.00g061210.m01.CDS01 [Anthostomella pinea]|uniref:Uu.00g061210.m01.CDS01 n=1 Tax=Anthostomella pinea TaxID=933095 RepID=A0AAI8VSG2_9PEZI|nr:Uu.00g061210.m01.CDS01 [Anthostomella pinea]
MSDSQLCLTPACIKAAADMLTNLHPNYQAIDPCENFDLYACGGYPARFPNALPESTLGQQVEKNQYVLRNILESPYPGTSDGIPDPDDEYIFKQMVSEYNACMDADAIEVSGLAGVPDIISQIVTLFPVDEDDYTSNATITTEEDYDNLARTLVYLNSVGAPGLGLYSSDIDSQNPDFLVPYIQATVELGSVAALNATEITANLVNLLPSQAALDAIDHLSQGILDFALAMAPAVEAVDESDIEALYFTTTIASVTKEMPALVIDKIIQQIVPPDYKADRIRLAFPEFWSNLSPLLANTPKSTLQTLLIALTYVSYAPYVADSTTTGEDRFDTCFNVLDLEGLAWTLSKFFVDVAYDNEAREFSSALVTRIRETFTERLDQLDWMDDATRALAKQKVANIDQKIGYSETDPNARNVTALREYYAGVNMTTSHFNNTLSLRTWATNHTLSLLSSGAHAPRSAWSAQSRAYTTNANYHGDTNDITVPAGISQRPLLDPAVPAVLSYARFAFIAGHELTHGFDTNGRLFDPERRQRNWYTPSTLRAFEERTECFVHLYNNMTLLDDAGLPIVDPTTTSTTPSSFPLAATINGTLTLAENLADAGGLTLAHAAWRRHEEATAATTRASKPLPGLNNNGGGPFSDDQVFFLGYAQNWCDKTTAAAALQGLGTDNHAPGFARILGPVAGSQAFREAFGCAVREPACVLW